MQYSSLLNYARKNSILGAVSLTAFLIGTTSLATFYVKYEAKKLGKAKAEVEAVEVKVSALFHFITEMDKGVRGFLVEPDEKFLGPYSVSEYIQPNFNDLQAMLEAQSFPDMRLFVKAKQSLMGYRVTLDEVISLRQQGNQEAALVIYREDPGGPVWAECNAFAQVVRSFEETILQKAEKRYETVFRMATLMQILLLLVGAPTLIFVIFQTRRSARRRSQLFNELATSQRQYLYAHQEEEAQPDEKNIINRLIQSLEQAAAFIKEIARGNYAVHWEGITEDNQADNQNNLAGALIQMREQMKIVKRDDQQRLWTTEGLSKVAEITRTHQQDVDQLTDRLLSYLVNYLEANQGSLFFLQEDILGEQCLTLAACYAYDKKKHNEKTIKIGQGLVGQTFLEKKTRHLTQLPPGYVQITSGLGEATPTSLLLVPLIFNEQVMGVLEVASFTNFAAHQISFLETVGEVIASAVATVRMNAQTKQLLAQSQEGTEALRAQEEEMRQNMEELQATQEEMQRKAQEYEAVIEEQKAIIAQFAQAEQGS